jgi:crotonobetainyl-CoA:carnitine CoA-transferase CaiB-like acyl-CoA transferase
LNAAKIGCARVFNTRPIRGCPLRRARDDRAGAGPPVGRADPRLRRRAENVVDPGRIRRGAPSIGDDTTDILARMLGLSEGAIDKLYADGVVHRTEPFTEP